MLAEWVTRWGGAAVGATISARLGWQSLLPSTDSSADSKRFTSSRDVSVNVANLYIDLWTRKRRIKRGEICENDATSLCFLRRSLRLSPSSSSSPSRCFARDGRKYRPALSARTTPRKCEHFSEFQQTFLDAIAILKIYTYVYLNRNVEIKTFEDCLRV